jgi:hypothetical protein
MKYVPLETLNQHLTRRGWSDEDPIKIEIQALAVDLRQKPNELPDLLRQAAKWEIPNGYVERLLLLTADAIELMREEINRK